MYRASSQLAAVGLFSCALLLLQLGLSAAQANPAVAGGAAAAGTCPLKSEDFARTDFSIVKKSCDVSAMADVAFCKSCVCGLGTAIVLGFQQAGVKINGKPVTEIAAAGDINTMNTLLNNCSAEMGIELLQAGALSAEALQQLTECNVSETSLNCAGEGGAAAGAPLPGQTASSGSAAAQTPAGGAASTGASQSPASQPAAAPATASNSAAGAEKNVNAVAAVGMVVAAAWMLL